MRALTYIATTPSWTRGMRCTCDVRIGFEPLDVGEVEDLHVVDGAGAQARDDPGLVWDDLEGDPVQVRQALTPVVRVLLQDDLAARGPLLEHERPGPHAGPRKVAVLLDGFLGNDLAALELGEHPEDARERLPELHLDRVRIDDLRPTGSPRSHRAKTDF